MFFLSHYGHIPMMAWGLRWNARTVKTRLVASLNYASANHSGIRLRFIRQNMAGNISPDQ